MGMIVLVLMLTSLSINVAAPPYTLFGYALYEDGVYADGAYVDAENLNNGDHIKTTVTSKGLYSFDCGSPGPGWKDGDEIRITIVQNISDEYLAWSGIDYIIIDENVYYQQISNITLYPPDNYPPNIIKKPSGPTAGYTNISYNYSIYASDPEDNYIYYWFTWNDGSNSGWVGPYESSDVISISHSWLKPGSFDIRVKAKDTSDSCSDWSPILSVEISNQTNTPENQTENIAPIANFSYSFDMSTSHNIVQFTDLSIDSDGDVVAWLWDFGAGNTSTNQSIAHKYLDGGIYMVTLTVWDDDGMINIIQQQITVSFEKKNIAKKTLTPEPLLIVICLFAVLLLILLKFKRKRNKNF